MRHWDEIARFEREGFDIVVEKTYEDTHPRDHFDEAGWNIRDICRKIDNGTYDWFLLRVRASVRGRVLAEEYLSACLYEDASEVLRDGTADDLIYRALERARNEALILQGLLKSLLDKSPA